MTETHEKMLTVRELAEEVRRTPKTVYRWIQEGVLVNVFRVRDGYLIPRKEAERMKERVNPTN